IEILAVGEGADDEAAVADGDRLQLAGCKTVLRDVVDGRGAAGTGKLGETAEADVDRDVAERLTADGHIRNCDRRTRWTRQRAIGAEYEGCAGIDPGHLGAGCIRIGLIEEIPAVVVGTAQRGAVGFGPAQLQVDRRAGRVESGYRSAANGFLLKDRRIVTNHQAGAGGAAA